MKHRIVCVWMGWWMVSAPLPAGVPPPLSIEQLAAQASLIVRAKVTRKSCQRDPEGRIYTKILLEVLETWKGRAPSPSFEVAHGGGILGEERVVVAHQAAYDVGEEVVAFLIWNQRGEGVTLGLGQGKFHVWQNATGELCARNPFHGTAHSGDAPSSGGVAADSKPWLTLRELKDRAQSAGGTR